MNLIVSVGRESVVNAEHVKKFFIKEENDAYSKYFVVCADDTELYWSTDKNVTMRALKKLTTSLAQGTAPLLYQMEDTD